MIFNKINNALHPRTKRQKVHGGGTFRKKNKGFSLVELVIVIAILAILIAVLAPSLMTYTERSRAQKDVTTMDEVVNAVQLAMADQKCYDEMLRYSCNNNFITYSDSSGNYGQQIIDAEYWAPDGLGRATTITFNPEKASNGDTIYRLENALVNDMTYGNGSVAENRTMQGAQIDNNQCYLKNASLNGSDSTGYLYNRVRQSIGDSVIATSATYANSSFTIFIRFNQKDGVTVADVNGAFNGTNLSPDSDAAKGSGTTSYDKETNKPIVNTDHTPGKTEANFSGTALQGGGSFTPDYKNDTQSDSQIKIEHNDQIPQDGTYYVGVTAITLGDYSGATETYSNGEFPSTVSIGDVYVYEDYEYKYGYYFYWDLDGDIMEWDRYQPVSGWGVGVVGWGARVLNSNKESYKPMLSSINNQPVIMLESSFAGCHNLKTAPVISQNAKGMYGCFYQCYEMADAPVLPDGLIDASWSFDNCYALKTAPVLPESVELINGMFCACESLVTYKGSAEPTGSFHSYKIPSKVTDITCTFDMCTSMIRAPQIPNTIKKMGTCFFHCESLQQAPSIPPSVETMSWAFAGCTALQNAPDMSKATNVINMAEAFYNCTSLKSGPDLSNCKQLTNLKEAFYNCKSMEAIKIIPQNVTNMYKTFDGCSSLISAPDISNATKITEMDYSFNGCKLLKTYYGSSDPDGDFSKYVLPTNLKIMTHTFKNCDSIVIAPIIPESVQDLQWAFLGCDNLTTVYRIPSNVTKTHQAFDGCVKLQGEIIIDTPARGSSSCFGNTKLQIKLTGSSPNLKDYVGKNSNITY